MPLYVLVRVAAPAPERTADVEAIRRAADALRVALELAGIPLKQFECDIRE